MPYSQGLFNVVYPEPNYIQFLALTYISLGPILILFSHLLLCLPRDLFPVGLHVTIFKAFLPSSNLAKCSEQVNLKPFSSLFGVNIRFWILFSNALSLCSSIKARDHDSQPYNTTGNIIILYILIFKFLERRLKC